MRGGYKNIAVTKKIAQWLMDCNDGRYIAKAL
jgi:hypothetical protein